MPRPKGGTLTQEHKDNIRKTMRARWDLIKDVMAQQAQDADDEDQDDD